MHENSLCLMEIRIVPYTYLLDLKPQRRSFQIPAMAYQEVLDCIAKSYAGGNILMNIGTGEAIGEPIRTVSGNGLGIYQASGKSFSCGCSAKLCDVWGKDVFRACRVERRGKNVFLQLPGS